MTIPLEFALRTPPSVKSQTIEIALVIVTAPKPPGSRQLISPAAAVLEIAPAKVLQGAVRLHGLASSPTPETQVRVACAFAGATASPINSNAPEKPQINVDFILMTSPSIVGLNGR